ncbi:endocuticle structural glycoprotein SgAbd-9-like [Schistocerca nitens]|uniref:endocuticle structural glycoprotein SgAbd-9-like n=1 Tax=Schistocerca nitens TaxID=7011 RepID=UPI002117BDE0|nr:endocuticle structural glycoprotein SgAbd-9-like [Schistocerca nitens]
MSTPALFLVTIMLHTVMSAPQQISSQQATVLEQFNNFNGIGPWRWSFTLSDGSRRDESGAVEDGDPSVSGSYKWKDPEGSVHQVHYVADREGYRTVPELGLGTNATLTLVGK